MDDPADVWLVYAHAESNRGTDDPRFIAQKKILVFGARRSCRDPRDTV